MVVMVFSESTIGAVQGSNVCRGRVALGKADVQDTMIDDCVMIYFFKTQSTKWPTATLSTSSNP